MLLKLKSNGLFNAACPLVDWVQLTLHEGVNCAVHRLATQMEWVAYIYFLNRSKWAFSLDRVVRLNTIHSFVILGLPEFRQDSIWLILSFVFGYVGSITLKRHKFLFYQVRYVFLHNAAFRYLCCSGLSSFRPATTLTKTIILHPKGMVALDYGRCVCSNGTSICPEIVGWRKFTGDGVRGCPLDKRTCGCSWCHERRELLSERLWRVLHP